tara:strand:- start:195432 stop:196574 length:1143 start_codon:yes stop_codon:yes gene_type:complete
MNDIVPTVGVEEEYQLVDPVTGELMPNCKEVMRTLRRSGMVEQTDSEIQHELHLNQIEMASDVCQTLEEVRQSLINTRSLLAAAARANGCELAAAGTNPLPLPETESLTPKDRYQAMTDRYQQIARELLIFGCHVHVAMPDRQLGLKVMNRCRRWLPLLQALTANSPYWNGVDTGYASYRRELWAQWPMAGPPAHFEDLDDYADCVNDLVACGAIKDESFIYWDIRLPTRVPTIEFRCGDVMTQVNETVGYVGLVRAIVMTAIAEEQRGDPVQPIRSGLLSYAIWHAARYGMARELIDPATADKVPAADLVDRAISSLSKSLDVGGERLAVDSFVENSLTLGTGADRQRREEDLQQVVRNVVLATSSSVLPADLGPSNVA